MIVFIDYDGTLTKNSEEEFMKAYFYAFSKKVNLPVEMAQQLVMESVYSAIKNESPNENMFDKFFDGFVVAMAPYGNHDRKYWIDFFIDFYRNEFDYVKTAIVPNEELINKVKTSDYQFIFASNPIQPNIAMIKKIGFVGLSPENFIYIACMENSTYAKPNPKFFKEIVYKLNLNPSDCIMIGDTNFDKASEAVGIKFVHVNDSLNYL